MLVISRRADESVIIERGKSTDESDRRELVPERIEIRVLEIENSRVRLGIVAPEEFRISREPR